MPEIYKNAAEAHESLRNKFEQRVADSVQRGSVIDLYFAAIGEEVEEMYELIEENKNPYLFSNTFGSDLDSLGAWVGIARETDEEDDHYKYRLKDWVLSSERSNTIAIENSLLNTVYSSNIQYVPYTHGAGTATCYVIPKEYEEASIAAALAEAKSMIKNVVSPSLYVEYVIPAMRAVRLTCYLSTSGDKESIKANIEQQVMEYINEIAPGDFLSIGNIVKLGLNTDGVEYFNAVAVYIDNDQTSELQTVQELETKFIFDEIVWTE